MLGQATVHSPSAGTVNVSVEDLTAALSSEIAALRSELLQVRTARENELRANLLTYIQALPEPELMKLTAGMSEEVLLAIQMLVDALMDRLGIPRNAGEEGGERGGGVAGSGVGMGRPAAGSLGGGLGGLGNKEEVVVQQSVGQLAQLCMWQMVVGYKLRELEVLEQGGAQLD